MFNLNNIKQQVEDFISNMPREFQGDFDVDGIMDELRDMDIESIEDVDMYEIAQRHDLCSVAGGVESLALNTVDKGELAGRMLPTKSYLADRCIQDVLRDYADVADYMNAFYAKVGRKSYDVSAYRYANALNKRLAGRIREVFGC